MFFVLLRNKTSTCTLTQKLLELNCIGFIYSIAHFFSMTSAVSVVRRKRRADRWRGVILLCLCFQIIVQSGRHPTVLQKLCQLPFQYFSDPRLIKVLFPSLIAACYNNPQNKIILEQEMSCVLLATFIQVRLHGCCAPSAPRVGLCTSGKPANSAEVLPASLQLLSTHALCLYLRHLFPLKGYRVVQVLTAPAESYFHQCYWIWCRS